MNAAAIQGSFADFKLIKSRSVAQLIIEIPIEHTDAALAALGGVPQPASERPVAVARLKPEAVAKPDARERYAKLTEGEQAVARASLLVDDREFISWAQAFARSTMSREGLVMWLRKQCGVQSRKELATDPAALARFLDLEARFKTERRFGPHAAR